ncbi:MAG TPA: hypothetical protein VKX96_16345, partial [Chloroflexota bacterium]|jgi:hypothetical protein|nr:hypothetical protein [Chloroflexota bacterium]
MAKDYDRELESQLIEAKAALQGQAEAMLDLLLQFESKLQARLDAAEARIIALREAIARQQEMDRANSAQPQEALTK